VREATRRLVEHGFLLRSDAMRLIREAEAATSHAKTTIEWNGPTMNLSLEFACWILRTPKECKGNVLAKQLLRLADQVDPPGAPPMAVRHLLILTRETVNGRPLDIEWAASHVPAILEAWHAGNEGGTRWLIYCSATPLRVESCR